jgi:hypothetical protein
MKLFQAYSENRMFWKIIKKILFLKFDLFHVVYWLGYHDKKIIYNVDML